MNKRTDKDRNILLRIKSASFLFVVEAILLWLFYFFTLSFENLITAILFSLMTVFPLYISGTFPRSNAADDRIVHRTTIFNFSLAVGVMIKFGNSLSYNLIISCIGMALPVIWVAIYILIPHRWKIRNWIRRKIKKKKP